MRNQFFTLLFILLLVNGLGGCSAKNTNSDSKSGTHVTYYTDEANVDGGETLTGKSEDKKKIDHPQSDPKPKPLVHFRKRIDLIKDSDWFNIPASYAQCTGHQDHFGVMRMVEYPMETHFEIKPLNQVIENAVQNERVVNPYSWFIGNGPIYNRDGTPNGYVVSNGLESAALDCTIYKSSTENIGKENSVFVKYHPRKKNADGTFKVENRFQYKVVATDLLCSRFQNKIEAEGEDLMDPSQIIFAFQSGPGVLRNGENLLFNYNQPADFRSYLGVTEKGKPVLVEARGKIGSYCLGEFLKTKGVVDLIHRDSNVSDASFVLGPDLIEDSQKPNPSAKAASLLIISAPR